MRHKHDLNFNAKLYGKEKFGFRKLSVGLAAVALGTCFVLNSGQLVSAADNATETAVQQSASQSSSATDTSTGISSADTATTSADTSAESTSQSNSSDSSAESTATANTDASAENTATASTDASAESTTSDSAAKDGTQATAVSDTQETAADQPASGESEQQQATDDSAAETAESSKPSSSQTETQPAKESSVSYNVTVYDSAESAQSAAADGEVSSSADKPVNLTPGNQNIYLRFSVSGITQTSSPLTIAFDNAGGLGTGSSKDFVLSFEAGTTPLLEQNKAVWNLINNGDGTLTLSRVENTNATHADFYIPVQANRAINPGLSDEGKDSSLTPVITAADGSAVPSASG
ncbi:YSIRK-type signal peptide-containing protein, partial [Lactobacillus nasalidis]